MTKLAVGTPIEQDDNPPTGSMANEQQKHKTKQMACQRTNIYIIGLPMVPLACQRTNSFTIGRPMGPLAGQ